MPSRAIRKRRSSVTDSMASNAQKIQSGVDRQLIELLDSETHAVKLAKLWPEAPAHCVVVVPGVRGHFNYICNIHERLLAEGFTLGLPYPHRPKPAVVPTPEQKAMIEANRLRALSILSARQANAA